MHETAMVRSVNSRSDNRQSKIQNLKWALCNRYFAYGVGGEGVMAFENDRFSILDWKKRQNETFVFDQKILNERRREPWLKVMWTLTVT